MAIEIVDFPIKNCGSFHSYVKVYQAGYITNCSITSLSMLRRFAFIPLFMLGQRSPESCWLWGSDAPQMHNMLTHSWAFQVSIAGMGDGWGIFHCQIVWWPWGETHVLQVKCSVSGHFLTIWSHSEWLSMATSMTGIGWLRLFWVGWCQLIQLVSDKMSV